MKVVDNLSVRRLKRSHLKLNCLYFIRYQEGIAINKNSFVYITQS